MKTGNLNTVAKFYFGYQDIARAFDITMPSARVTASRYANAGLEDLFKLANLIQGPS